MGYILNAIAVDLEQVTRAFGSRDARLLEALAEKFPRTFQDIDELAARHAEDFEEGDQQGITTRDALAHMINGEPYREDYGFVYGYALELVCGHFGETLPNGEWSAMRYEWFTKVDQALEAAGVDASALRVIRLFFRDPPVRLPVIDDFPAIGYMRRSEIAATLAAFGAKQLADVAAPAERAALAQLRVWLQTCARTGRDLVTFYA